jgi:uncharacterized protein
MRSTLMATPSGYLNQTPDFALKKDAVMKLPIDYVEFASPHLEATQAFFAKAFGWEFIDYGPNYRDIQGAGLSGGLERAALVAPVIILKADDLEAARATVLDAGAELVRNIYSFPGGRRFEFKEPGGNVMAVWTPVSESHA